MNNYMVRTEHPNNWTGDGYRTLSYREQAEVYAKDRAHGTLGQEDYVLATIYIALETHDQLIRTAKAELLEKIIEDFDSTSFYRYADGSEGHFIHAHQLQVVRDRLRTYTEES